MNTDISESLCRLCSVSTLCSTLVPLYAEQKTEREVTQKIKALIGDNLVVPDDGLPQEICLSCLNEVERCYNFVTKAVTSYTTLRFLTDVNSGRDSQVQETKKGQLAPTTIYDKCSLTLLLEEKDMVKGNDVTGDESISEGIVTEVLADETEETGAAVKMGDEQEEETTTTVKEQSDKVLDEYGSIINSQNAHMDDSDDDYQSVIVLEGEDNDDGNYDDGDMITLNNDDDDDDVGDVLLHEEAEYTIVTTDDDELLLKHEEDEGGVLEAEIVYTITDTGEINVLPNNYELADTVEQRSLLEVERKLRKDVTFGKLEDGYHVLFRCKNCSRQFDSDSSFVSHYCNNADGKKVVTYRCDYCDNEYKSLLVCLLHLEHHYQSMNFCTYCKKVIDDPGVNLHAHLKKEHRTSSLSHWSAAVNAEGALNNISSEDARIQCDVCGKICSDLDRHKLYHAIDELERNRSRKRSRKEWFLCTICNKKVYTEISYLFHMAKHNGETGVRCKRCDFVTDSFVEYNMHVSKHTGEVCYICNDCDRRFVTRSAIADHVQVHMEGMRYMCEHCGQRFKTSRAHAQHKLLQHKKYFRCSKCNRGFSKKEKLRVHNDICIAISNAENTIQMKEMAGQDDPDKSYCDICQTRIKSSSDITMQFHKAKHEGKEGVHCQNCNVLCRNVYTYRNHMLIHTKERPYTCNQCPKSFRTKGCLMQHMLVHADEYKYTCKYCGKKSKKLTTHINHVNIHTDTRPYNCPDCQRPFRQMSDMKKHRRTHHKPKKTSEVEQRPARSYTYIPVLIPMSSQDIKEEVVVSTDNVLF